MFLHTDAGVILIGEAIQAYKCLVLEEIKGCQVIYCIVGKRVNIISRFLYSTCANNG